MSNFNNEQKALKQCGILTHAFFGLLGTNYEGLEIRYRSYGEIRTKSRNK